jgi:hypothetical protein
MKLVARDGRIELVLLDGDSEQQRAIAERLDSAGLNVVLQLDDNGRALLRSIPQSDGEGDEWFALAAAGGSFDFWDNEQDDAIWNNA